MGVTSFYDKILEAENAKTGTPSVLHGKKEMLPFHLLLPEKYADFVVVVRICQHFSWKGKKGVQGIKILGV